MATHYLTCDTCSIPQSYPFRPGDTCSASPCAGSFAVTDSDEARAVDTGVVPLNPLDEQGRQAECDAIRSP